MYRRINRLAYCGWISDRFSSLDTPSMRLKYDAQCISDIVIDGVSRSGSHTKFDCGLQFTNQYCVGFLK